MESEKVGNDLYGDGSAKVIAGLSIDERTLREATGAEFATTSELDAMDWSNPASRALPGENEVLKPFGWRMLIMPMRPESKSAGGIIIPQVRQDTDQYLNYCGRIVSMGSLCFKHPKWGNMGMTEADRPKVGDWIVYPIYQYQRIDFKGVKLIILNDDSFIATVPEGVSPWDFKLER